MKRTLAIVLGVVSLSAFATDYHVDAVNGSDDNAGDCPDFAWRSLEKVNASSFKPGDRILLRCGDSWNGQLILDDSGSSDAPIVISSYESGNRPAIHGEGKFQEAVLLENVSHVIVEGLEVTNTGSEPKARRRGILARFRDCGVARNVILRNIFVHDVNGVISKSEGGGTAIRWEVVSRKKKTRIDGLLIEDCHVLRCDRDAIKGWMDPWTDMSSLSTNVVIRNNLLEDIGGDGIVPIGTDGAVVEFNRLYGARQRFDPTIPKVSQYAGASAGMWPWSSKNTLFRFNEVWGYRGTFDGQGFDSDYNCSGTVFEYNLSADNAGGFFLICNKAEQQDSGNSIGNFDSVIRHNISLNDHVRSFVISGPVKNITIEGNIIFNNIEEELPLIIDTPWGRLAESVNVIGNLFYTTGEAQIFQGTWANDGLGNCKYHAPINRETVKFSDNAYSNISNHEESGMQSLDERETLQSLIDRFEDNPEAAAGFNELLSFLKQSRYWEHMQKALSGR